MRTGNDPVSVKNSLFSQIRSSASEQYCQYFFVSARSSSITASSPICRPSRYVKNTSAEMITSLSNSAKQIILFIYNQNNKIRT